MMESTLEKLITNPDRKFEFVAKIVPLRSSANLFRKKIKKMNITRFRKKSAEIKDDLFQEKKWCARFLSEEESPKPSRKKSRKENSSSCAQRLRLILGSLVHF